MAIKTGDVITKTDVMNYFNSNIIDYVYSTGTWNSSNYPVTTRQGKRNNGAVVVNTGVPLIPTNQLDSATKPYLTNIPNTIITASDVVTAITNIVNGLTRVRLAQYYWYHGEGNPSADVLYQSGSNKTIFKATTPAISGNTRPYYAKNPNTTTMTQPITIARGDIAGGKTISASAMITFFNNIKSAWNTTYNNKVTFYYYTCHNQCYSSCNRSRR